MTRLTMLFITVLAVLVSACGSKSDELTKVDQAKTLTLLRGDKSEDLDPHSTSSGGDVSVLSQMYEGLVKPTVGTENVEWEPCLAESFSENKDKTQATFKIRKGVTFHDGAKLDAHAVKKSLERLIVETAPSRPISRDYAYLYADIASVKATDDFTLVVKSHGPNPRLLSNLGIHPAMVVSPRAIKKMTGIEDQAARSKWLKENPAGTGPYTIKSPSDYKENGANVTLTGFKDYWGGSPIIERISFVTQSEVRQRTERLLAGDIDMTDNLDPGDWESLEENKNIHLYTWPGMNMCYVAMNVRKHITANLEVRKAITLAINRDPFVAKFSGKAVPQYVLLPPRSLGHPKGYIPPEDQVEQSEAIKRAMQMIKDAGAEGTTLKLLMPNVPRPYLLYHTEMANLIQQQLAEIGLEVEATPAPMSEMTANVESGDYPLTLLGWMGDSGEPDNFWRPLLGGKDGDPAPLNAARFYNEDVMERMNKAAVEIDPAKRQKLYEELEKFVFENFRPMCPLLSAQRSYAWLSKLTGVIVDSTGQYRLHKASFKE